jgi:HlyD family secretion protein
MGSGAGMRTRPERQVSRTVYVLPAKSSTDDLAELKPKPVQIKVGISDGVMTEVLEGLDEGAQVVTGIISSDLASGPGAQRNNPFGGGFRRF